jgi:hypothetical protein
LQHTAGNAAVAGLLIQRQSDAIERDSPELHTLHEMHGSAECEGDSWDPKVRVTFGLRSYREYINTILRPGRFFGQTVEHLHPDLIDALQKVEASLKASQGEDYTPPRIDSGFREHKGMHGWGMAVDFDVVKNPYVLNESGEAALDEQLKPTYDHVAQFMLGQPQSALRKLKQGRKAFGSGSIGDVYDALRKESDAMTRYFTLKDDDAALASFLASEWPALHPDQAAPDAATVKKQMVTDYEILGGQTSKGVKLPTGDSSDRPFAPTSSGGQGDPRTGFLNLPKEFVQTMSDAGLAWGAIDIAGEPGDVQHFDLRLMAQGKTAYDALVRPARR